MLRTYEFCGEEPIQFDDERTVGELVQYAFDRFGYYEPFGMDIVTVFQSQNPDTSCGWFTIDKNKKLKDEIIIRSWLSFGYYMPGYFYYVEDGWGIAIGNHPHIENPVYLKLYFDDFRNKVVFAGNLTMEQIIEALKRTDYIDRELEEIRVHVFGYPRESYTITYSISDPIMKLPLTEFEKKMPNERFDIILND